MLQLKKMDVGCSLAPQGFLWVRKENSAPWVLGLLCAGPCLGFICRDFSSDDSFSPCPQCAEQEIFER